MTLSNQPEAFALYLGDNQSHYLLFYGGAALQEIEPT